jgi:site-specific recombinase XerD
VKRRRTALPQWTHQHEVTAVLDAMPHRTPLDLRNRAMLEVLYSTACQTGELCQLDTTDVDAAHGGITLSRGNPRQRTLPLTQHAGAAIRDYLIAQPHSGPLWLTYDLHRITERSIRRALPCTPRRVRASTLTALLTAGCDLRSAQAVAGHACIDTTARYEQLIILARLTPDQFK